MANVTKENLDRLLLVFVHGFRGTDTSFKVNPKLLVTIAITLAIAITAN